MPKKRVTTYDVAREAKVSRTTVSYILNGRHDKDARFKKETVKKVIDTAERLGWVPNFSAQSLKVENSRLIGIVMGGLEDRYFGRIYNEAVWRFYEREYRTIIGLQHTAHEECEAIKQMISYNVMGVLIAPTVHESLGTQNMALLEAYDVPYVCVDTYKKEESNYVTTDNEGGMRQVMDYFVREKWIRRFIHLPLFWDVLPVIKRRDAFTRYCEEHSDDIDDRYVITSEDVDQANTEDGMIEKMIATLRKMRPTKASPVAITCFMDSIAARAKAYVERLPLPEGSVLFSGFGNFPTLDGLGVPFVTVDQHVTKIAHHAVEILLRHIEDATQPFEHVVVPTSLVLPLM